MIDEVEAKSVTLHVEIANHLVLAPSSLSRIMLNKNEFI
jgi:hypothetical protein